VSEDVDMANEPRPGPEAPRRPRGWVSLYAVAFLLLVGAGVAFTASASGLLESARLQWTSTVLSALAIVVAIVSVVLPRR
jgi:hypothetical protein